MRRTLRWILRGAAALALAATLAGGYLLLFHGRTPAAPPGLVRLPEDAPPAPGGYPTMNAVYLMYALGRVELLDPSAEVAIPEGVSVTLDVEYGRVEERPLLLDLYQPAEQETPAPGLLFIHGGGWSSGNKRDYTYYTVRFAERGFVAATVAYRLRGEALFPAAIEDVKCAVRWMRANAEELGVDPERIVVIGGSAGGHLAMLAGYAPGHPELEGGGGHAGISSHVAAVVNLYGPTDLRVPEARESPTVQRFLGAGYDEAPERYALASPLAHLGPEAPPTLIIHGGIDTIVPVDQADRLAAALKAQGTPYWYDRPAGWPHTLDIVPEMNERVQWLILRFLDAMLPPPASGEAHTASRPAA